MARRTLVTCQRVSQKHLENHWHGWATCIVWTIVKCFTTLEPQSHKICILLHTWLPTEHHLREEGAGPRDCPGPLLVSPNLVSWEFFKGQRNTRQRIPPHPVTQIQAFPGIFPIQGVTWPSLWPLPSLGLCYLHGHMITRGLAVPALLTFHVGVTVGGATR